MDLIDPTAKQCAFKKYYHYQPFCKDYLKATLRDRKLFCSDPLNVNDPWDCKPWFDYRPLLKDPARREDMITFFRSVDSPEMVNHPLRPRYEDSIRNDDNELKKALDRHSKLLAEQIGRRRIYCLTPFFDSTLMWSHYAAKHKGICLEFDKNNALIEKARPVRYSKTYPEWTLHGAAIDPLPLVLTKSIDWAYEREFRIVGSALDGPLKLHDNFVVLPEGALTAIILGCESPDHAEVLSVVNEYGPGLPLKRAVRVPNHYKLTVKD